MPWILTYILKGFLEIGEKNQTFQFRTILNPELVVPI